MAEIKDKIKKLLSKAKESGDIDMIELAMDLLEEIPVSAQEELFPKPKPTPHKFEEFSMNQVNNKQPRTLEVKARKNEFTDDGKEHADIETPKVTLQERRRPKFQKVEQTCTLCNKVVEVHPQFARDFYKCDRCMRR